MQKQGWELLREDWRSAVAQVDLVMIKSQISRTEILVLEVKSLSSQDWMEQRLKAKQRQRLERVVELLQSQLCQSGDSKIEVQLGLAFVGPEGEISIFTDF